MNTLSNRRSCCDCTPTAAIKSAMIGVATIFTLLVASRSAAGDKRDASPKVTDVVQRVQKSIVFISTRDAIGRDVGLGSGFVIESSGLVVTNYHVIAEAGAATVKFRDGAEFPVVGYRALDKKRDLAILEFKQGADKAPGLKLASPAALQQGDAVIAIGHPRGFGFTVTSGIIGATRRTSEMPQALQAFLRGYDPQAVWIQHSAPLGPGNSGGPLFNERGDLIGVNTWVEGEQGLNFAVHVDAVVALAKNLLDKPHPLPVPGAIRASAY